MEKNGMTYVEFLERDTLIDNLCSSLLSPPDRLVLIGENPKVLEKQAFRFSKILQERGADVEFLCRTVHRYNMSQALKVLTDIVERYDHCLFDLTGGDDVMLAAAGMIYERYRGKKQIQMHRYRIMSHVIQDCDLDEDTTRTCLARLSVDENLRIYGGCVVYDTVHSGATHNWALTEDFGRDIDAMWEICRKDNHQWNRGIGLLSSAEYYRLPDTDPLVTALPLYILNSSQKFIGGRDLFRRPFFRQLESAGLLRVRQEGEALLFTYKNEQVKRCLMKEGQALEMKVTVCAYRAREKDGTPSYQDVKNGVCIDWDGLIHEGRDALDTENEIDVMMMHGLIPVFVSCKNGAVKMDELYKLQTVARRFGGKYARKVLIVTGLESGRHARALKERARDMHIRLVDNISRMNEARLEKTVRTFWKS